MWVKEKDRLDREKMRDGYEEQAGLSHVSLSRQYTFSKMLHHRFNPTIDQSQSSNEVW